MSRPNVVCRAKRLAVGLLLAAGVLMPEGPIRAQDLGSEEMLDRPGWLRAWSPLHWTAGLPRSLPNGMSAVPEPLLWPGARAGLFWSAGNPGALSMEMDDSFATYSAGFGNTDGSYRRPLDPETVRGPFGEAMAWRPFGSRGAAIGRVRVGSVDLDRALSDYDLPYGGGPYVVMDTAGSNLGRTVVELEGAAAWKNGPLGFGLAFGYRAHHTRTREAPVPRSLSGADPAASVGLVWEFSPAFRIGAHGRWRRHAERVTIYTVAASTRLYRLQGFFEPPPQDLTTGYYQRRVEREGYAGGLSAGGTIREMDWAVYAEMGSLEERQHPPGFNDPDSDTWDTDGLSLGAALVRPFSVRNVLLSFAARYTGISGTAGRGDLPDTTTFVSDESVFHGEGEFSIDASDAVRLVSRLVLRYEDRTREDYLAHVRSPVQSWTTGVGVAAVVRATEQLALSGGVGNTWYGAGGGIPDPAEMGRAYGLFVAPEMALNATDAGSLAGTASASWQVRETVHLWAALRYSKLSATDQAVSLASQPEGDRKGYRMSIGFRVGS